MDVSSIAEAGRALRGELAHKNNSETAPMNDSIPGSTSLWRETNWFAIHTKSRREDFASNNVRALGIDVLLPRVKVDRLVAGLPQIIVKALFPGYFFARFCPQNCLEPVEYCHGVLKVVSSGRFPIPVEDKNIYEIQHRIEEDGYIRIRPQILGPGMRVTIQGGPFEGMIGRVERELDDRKRVAIFLEALFQARVLIEKRWIEAEAA